jgi:membrane-associated phospholipid phosphatase
MTRSALIGAGRPSAFLAAAGGCAVLVALTWLAAFRWPFGRRLDSELLHALAWRPPDLLDPLRLPAATLVDRGPYVLFALTLVAVGVRQGRRSRAAAAGALLVCAPAISEALARMVRQERQAAWMGTDQIGAGSWPSGHATGGLALVIAAGIVARPALPRTASAAAGAWLALLSYGILSLRWHYPSDVLAGFLVALTCGLAASAAVVRLDGVAEPSGRLRSSRI